MSTRFINHSVVITGAGGGIGSRAAVRFANEGALLTLIDCSLEKLIEVKEENNLPDEKCLLLEVDVANEDAMKNAIKLACNTYGKIDVMFNNAGIIGASALLGDFPSNSLRQVLNVNVMGTFLGMKYAIQAMLPNNKGVIVNTCSISGLRGMPTTTAYVASKHAIMGMTRSAATEYAKTGIRICAVCPSPVGTPMMQTVEDGMVNIGIETRESARRKLVDPIPMGRYATTDEVVSAVMFLASEEASFITGSAIMIDGGFTA